ncbi:hypothetical protein [Azonexus sp.]|uniref:hypothetical protein n=1 Tax=Azonexus sp. TaxID=1872668 RepID=UPI0027B96CC9|nr:hypothetical protein [Azonexus sp.]
MTTSGINQIVLTLDAALHRLGKTVPMPEVERLAIQIHRTMDNPNRAYHTSRHVFDVCAGASPLATLAALYHDIAYFQLDRAFPVDILPGVDSMVERVDQDFILHIGPKAGLPLRLSAAVFGFSDGARLAPLGGLNEFVSAVIAASVLEPWLAPAELLTVIACIEATVPFRPAGADGACMPESLYRRLALSNTQFGLGCSAQHLRGITGEAVALANRDVGGFAEPDPAQFLANTWLLIEESNAALVAVGVYTVRDYRQALGRMEGFLSFLNPANIFHTFDGIPPTAEFTALSAAAGQNLEFARRYLAGKLSALAIIEALAMLTGGDCPISMLLGDIASGTEQPAHIEDCLPPVADHPDVDQKMLDVFDQGRRAESQRDSSQSPLTAYVYRHLGESGTLALFAHAKAMFAEQTTPAEFLRHVDPALRQAIAHGCAQIAVSRTALLRALAG